MLYVKFQKGKKKVTDPTKFPRTTAALSEINSALDALTRAIAGKTQSLNQQRQNYKQNMNIKSAQLEIFRQSAAKALDTVGRSVQKIDEVLKENVASHDHD
jgi:hypothetical protein